jgi:hypothetical protein
LDIGLSEYDGVTSPAYDILRKNRSLEDLKAKYRQEIDLIKEYKERLIYDVVTGKINLTQEASHVRL